MENQRKLQVWETIYCECFGRITVETVLSVTKTKATTNRKTELRVDVPSHGLINRFSKERHDSYSYYIETPELKQNYQRQALVRVVSSIDFTKPFNRNFEKNT